MHNRMAQSARGSLFFLFSVLVFVFSPLRFLRGGGGVVLEGFSFLFLLRAEDGFPDYFAALWAWLRYALVLVLGSATTACGKKTPERSARLALAPLCPASPGRAGRTRGGASVHSPQRGVGVFERPDAGTRPASSGLRRLGWEAAAGPRGPGQAPPSPHRVTWAPPLARQVPQLSISAQRL